MTPNITISNYDLMMLNGYISNAISTEHKLTCLTFLKGTEDVHA